MNREINLRLAAALLPLLVATAILAIAYATHSSDGENRSAVLTSESPVGFDTSRADARPQVAGIQECRAGPSKCTGQPGLVPATFLNDRVWMPDPPGLAREIFPDYGFALEAPTYRMKPPPRAA